MCWIVSKAYVTYELSFCSLGRAIHNAPCQSSNFAIIFYRPNVIERAGLTLKHAQYECTRAHWLTGTTQGVTTKINILFYS